MCLISHLTFDPWEKVMGEIECTQRWKPGNQGQLTFVLPWDLGLALFCLPQISESYSMIKESSQYFYTLTPSPPSHMVQVTESLERVKSEMDERGSNMIDAGPLVRIKQALTRLRSECTQMDVRIGVVSLMT